MYALIGNYVRNFDLFVIWCSRASVLVAFEIPIKANISLRRNPTQPYICLIKLPHLCGHCGGIQGLNATGLERDKKIEKLMLTTWAGRKPYLFGNWSRLESKKPETQRELFIGKFLKLKTIPNRFLPNQSASAILTKYLSLRIYTEWLIYTATINVTWTLLSIF